MKGRFIRIIHSGYPWIVSYICLYLHILIYILNVYIYILFCSERCMNSRSVNVYWPLHEDRDLVLWPGHMLKTSNLHAPQWMNLTSLILSQMSQNQECISCDSILYKSVLLGMMLILSFDSEVMAGQEYEGYS